MTSPLSLVLFLSCFVFQFELLSDFCYFGTKVEKVSVVTWLGTPSRLLPHNNKSSTKHAEIKCWRLWHVNPLRITLVISRVSLPKLDTAWPFKHSTHVPSQSITVEFIRNATQLSSIVSTKLFSCSLPLNRPQLNGHGRELILKLVR